MSKINLDELNVKSIRRYNFTKQLNKKLKNGYILSDDDHMELANINKEIYLEFKQLVEIYPDLITNFYVNKMPVRYKQFGGDDAMKQKYNYLLLKTIADKKKRNDHISDLNKIIVKNLKNKMLENL